MDIWDKVKALFRSAEESSASNPAVHEVIERSPAEIADYQVWKKSLTCRRLTDWLDQQYGLRQALPDEVDEALDFLDTPSSKGFVIHLHKTEYPKRDVLHFLDYLQERVVGMGYRPQLSDTRTFSQNNWVETVERHYLKPRFVKNEEDKLLQRFGNITIDLTFRNDKPYNLKFRATSYSDRLYVPGEDFSVLMEELLRIYD